MIQYLVANDYVGLVSLALALVIALSLHEFAHALAAELQGDPTPRLDGRLTLNPKAHLDPFGAVMMVLVGFGWGKPVTFNPVNLRNRKAGTMIVAAAGPAMNIALAFAFGALLALLEPGRLLGTFLLLAHRLNVLLGIFNLIPIPPLDGYRILAALVPPSRQRIVFFLDKWGFLLLLALVFFVLPGPLSLLTRRISALILALVS